MDVLNKIKIHEFTIEIHADLDAQDPIKDFMEGIERWNLNRGRNEIAENKVCGEDAFFLALAQSIYTYFPDYLKGSDHAEKIARKYYAISSDVGNKDTVYLVGLKSELIRIYGCPNPQKLIEMDAEIYKAWANGDCVGYITKDEDGKTIDSCWGFFSHKEAIEVAKENLPTRDDQYYFDKSEN